MKPPNTINVLDSNNGFTAVTRAKTYVKIVMGLNGEREVKYPDDYPDGRLCVPFMRWQKVTRESGTMWRPAYVLKHGTIGMLDGFKENSFYQTNNNVTIAWYKVPGYSYRIAVWFDNITSERIA